MAGRAGRAGICAVAARQTFNAAARGAPGSARTSALHATRAAVRIGRRNVHTRPAAQALVGWTARGATRCPVGAAAEHARHHRRCRAGAAPVAQRRRHGRAARATRGGATGGSVRREDACLAVCGRAITFPAAGPGARARRGAGSRHGCTRPLGRRRRARFALPGASVVAAHAIGAMAGGAAFDIGAAGSAERFRYARPIAAHGGAPAAPATARAGRDAASVAKLRRAAACPCTSRRASSVTPGTGAATRGATRAGHGTTSSRQGAAGSRQGTASSCQSTATAAHHPTAAGHTTTHARQAATPARNATGPQAGSSPRARETTRPAERATGSWNTARCAPADLTDVERSIVQANTRIVGDVLPALLARPDKSECDQPGARNYRDSSDLFSRHHLVPPSEVVRYATRRGLLFSLASRPSDTLRRSCYVVGGVPEASHHFERLPSERRGRPW